METPKNIVWLAMIILVIFPCSGKRNKSVEPQSDILTGRWMQEPEYMSCNNINWYPGNSFSFCDSNSEYISNQYGSGSYIYQPETKEVFADIYDMNAKQFVDDTLSYEMEFYKYFRIIKMTDSTVVVQTLLPQSGVYWQEYETGKYQLCFTGAPLAELPFVTKTYNRIKETFNPQIDENGRVVK